MVTLSSSHQVASPISIYITKVLEPPLFYTLIVQEKNGLMIEMDGSVMNSCPRLEFRWFTLLEYRLCLIFICPHVSWLPTFENSNSHPYLHLRSFLLNVPIMPITHPTTKAKTNALPPISKTSGPKSKPPNSKSTVSSAPASKSKTKKTNEDDAPLSAAEVKKLKELQAKLNAGNAKARAAQQAKQDERK
jgi:hypothetical protein